MLPSNVSTGRVTGRFIVGVQDGPDPDDEPDFIAAVGTIDFTASVPYLPNPTDPAGPVTLLKTTIRGVLDDAGNLCTINPDGTPGVLGLRLVATDDPDLLVQNWTWNVTYRFQPVNGTTPAIPSHGLAVLSGSVVDLTVAVKVPSSPGYGLPQSEAAVLRAEAAAGTVAEAVELVVEAGSLVAAAGAEADRAAAAAATATAPTDATVANKINTPGTLTNTALSAAIDEQTEQLNDAIAALPNTIDDALVPALEYERESSNERYSMPLGQVIYAPAGYTAFTASSGSFQNVSSDQLKLAFTAPASGSVSITFSAWGSCAFSGTGAATEMAFNLRDSGGDVSGTVQRSLHNGKGKVNHEWFVYNLTPGNSYTYWVGFTKQGGEGVAMVESSPSIGAMVLKVASNYVPLPKVRPFVANFASSGVTQYQHVTHPERISIVNDPELGVARKVARMEVHNTDTEPTINPRAQLELSTVDYGIATGSEFWWGTGIYLPANFPVLTHRAGDSVADWLVFAEVYGAPSVGQSAAQLGVYGDDSDSLMLNINPDAVGWFNRRVWKMPIIRGKWVDFAFRVRLSTNPKIGFYEMYVNFGHGWERQLLEGQVRLYFSTLNSSHDIGPNKPTIKNYRKVNTFDVVTCYFAGHKIGSSLAAVDMRSHG